MHSDKPHISLAVTSTIDFVLSVSGPSLSAVLEKWLQKNYNVKRFGEPSWSLVVRAVSHPAGGGNCALALRIATKYGGNVSTQLTTVAL